MWELDCEESWVPKNWCFWSVVLEKTLESPLDSKEIQPVHSEGDQPWVFFGRMMLKLKLQYFGHLMRRVDSLEKTLMLGGIGGKRRRGWQDEMAGWHHWLDGCESEWTPGVGDGQGGLACCDSWGQKESDMTERLIWSDLKDVHVSGLYNRKILKSGWRSTNTTLFQLIIVHPYTTQRSIVLPIRME